MAATGEDTSSASRAAVPATSSICGVAQVSASARGKQGRCLQTDSIPSQGSSATALAAAQAAVAAQQAQQAAQNSQQSMLRATQAIRAMQAAQAAARAAAAGAPETVASGLALGGLVPDSGLAATGVANPVTTWVGANTPTQTTSGGQTTVTINQTPPTALPSA